MPYFYLLHFDFLSIELYLGAGAQKQEGASTPPFPAADPLTYDIHYEHG